MPEKMKETQLAVIGAGPGGYPAAFLAADKGMRVALIDSETNPGGVCLYRGCIPTKTLLHVTQVIRESEKAEAWGVTYNKPGIDLDRLRAWKNSVIQKMTGGLGQLTKQRRIDYFRGHARFSDAHTLEIRELDGNVKHLSFEKAVLSPGSMPVNLPNITADSPRIMHSAEAMELATIPESLLVVGGGYIGLEMGTIYASLGSKVDIIEMMPDILPGADPDLVRTYKMTARKLFSNIMTNSTVTGMEEADGKMRVTLKNHEGHSASRIYEKVLLSLGRRPNTADLGLENTSVEIDSRGFIRTDAYLRTSEASIWAVGDAVGGAMLAHKATHEGKAAVENIMGNRIPFEPKATPAVLFTDPEVSWCGLTESAAAETGRDVKIVKFPWGASGRAASLGRMDGVTKFILEPGNGRILGMAVVGPGAGELISEGALAVELGAKAEDVAKTIHPHPTLSETLMEAAELFLGTCTHLYRPRQ